MPDMQDGWKKWWPRLFAWSADFAGLSEQDREDALQEAFTTALRKLQSYNTRWALSTWLFAIARNKLRDAQRRARRLARRQSARDVECLAFADDPQTTGADVSWRADLQLALAKLDERDRQLLFLQVHEDMSLADMAKVSGMLAGTIKSRLSRARAKLRALLAGGKDE